MLGWKKTNRDTGNMDEKDKPDRRHEYFVITLRFAAAIYILYMGFLALKNALDGQAGISLPVAIIVALVFLAAAVGILLNAWRAWKKMKQSMAEESKRQQEEPSSGENLLEASDGVSDEEP